MGNFTLQDGLAIWQLMYYVAALVCSIFVSCRHGLLKSSGWIFLAIFSCIRLIGCSAQIATVTSQSGDAETIATITGFLGLSPLLLATLGVLSRVYFSMMKSPWNFAFSFFLSKMVQIPALIALILCVVGATSANTPADVTSQDTVKAGVIVYLVVLVLLIVLTVGAAITRSVTSQPCEGTLLLGVAASLPFLLLRIIHSLLLIFDQSLRVSAAEASTSSVLMELFMAKIEEMIVVLIFLCAGLKQPAVPGDDGTQTNREKLMYRVSRGDFGGGKLGIASLAIAAGSALVSNKRHAKNHNLQHATATV